jgi:hypothetical protein
VEVQIQEHIMRMERRRIDQEVLFGVFLALESSKSWASIYDS